MTDLTSPHRIEQALKADLSGISPKATETITAALKKFVPKKPKVTAYAHSYVTHCPNCLHQLTGGIDVPYSPYDFCPWCG